MFIKIICSNGFCGCDEETYVKVANAEEAEMAAEACLDWHSFADPDERFCDMENEEEIENYYEGITVSWEEVFEEEYLENVDN